MRLAERGLAAGSPVPRPRVLLLGARAVIRNASGAGLLPWPLGAQPLPLKAGETRRPIAHTARERQQALIERGGCLHTYPAPDYFALPEGTRGYAPRVAVVIREDMSLHLHRRSKKGEEGPEILAAGFPLKPATFCGRRAEGSRSSRIRAG